MRPVPYIAKSLDTAVLPYLIILGFCVFLLVRAFAIPAAPDGQLGAAVWPKTILVLALITCAFEVARNLWKPDAWSRMPEEGHAVQGHDAHEVAQDVPAWLPWVGIALTVTYVLLLSQIGYFLATVGFTAAFIYLGKYRRPVSALVVALVAAFSFVFIFMKIVYVALPLGQDPFARLSTLIMALMGIH